MRALQALAAATWITAIWLYSWVASYYLLAPAVFGGQP